ncbi:hypothetical protein GobsT_53560 [Gemmata obscuriglobus]|uniref:hypothetical protein n=1 Tax=Gemmata obscuriglobus TaxID=114 RepID=UPI00016C5502|nr:hypothetical protein [Gemmata obscuriglobus]QEG30551.1 hypothetical protein GobsT_53560 [Gemmata obscuriglobus]VTS09875.1 Uncultured bacterium genome assembly Metasoil_fosmids_resub OS=uncultured bacterium PE=4 SV=1 [Gemmata obscuriglobus UQM 2246]
MKRALFGLAAFVAGVALMTSSAVSQPPDGKGGKGAGKGGMRAGFKLGTILPPFMVEELKLTDEQKTQLADLEKDVKTKLDKLLTDEQKKSLENARPGGGFPGGQGGDKGGKGGGKGGDKGGKGDRQPGE